MRRPGVDRGGLAAALGGLVLTGSLFLDWYSYPTPPHEQPPSGDITRTAWEAFSTTDVLLVLLAGTVVLLALLAAVKPDVIVLRYGSGLILGVAGIAVLTLVVIRFAVPPGSEKVLGVVGTRIEATRLGGSFVGLGAAVVMALGGVAAASAVILARVSRTLDRMDRGL